MAQRKQQNRRPKKNKNKNKKKKPLNAVQIALLQRIKNSELPLPSKVILDSPDHEKMSEVVQEFVRSLLDEAPDDESIRPIIELGIMAWNLAIIKEHDGEQAIEKILRETAKPGTADAMIEEFKPFLEKLFKRKRELFPDNQRMILDYELTESRDNFHLNVVSLVPGEEAKQLNPGSKIYQI